ncbi:MAG: hypothetical protein OEZ33_04550 [Gammaproteobacteria bacterium]|nr:hypothetical protein [Gammaproteobacteria bacterium]MDH5777458.1 hypothetical protein [Gammaproteobacteria bacterium]
MSLPVLNLPKISHFRLIRLPGRFALRQLQKWGKHLADLPVEERIGPCMKRLIRMNSMHYSVQTRLNLLGALQLIIHDSFKSEKRLIRQSRSQAKGSKPAIQRLDKLYAELANGYKLLIHSISKHKQLSDHDALLIQEAIYFALKFIARRLLLAYAQYQPVSKGLWRELNQIYRYADDQSLLFHIIDDPMSDSSFPVFHSGDLIYKRIILVALAEPYRLMHDECLELYNLASRWTSACSLFPISKVSTQGEHLVDLADDLAPRFVTTDLSWQPMDGRVIDITEVIQRVESDLRGLLHNDPLASDFELLDLEERQKRDMLLRVVNTYQGKPIRRSKRFALGETIEFTTTINACHHALLKGQDFTPEMDELKYLSTSKSHTSADDTQDFGQRYQQALNKSRRFKSGNHTLYNAAQLNINPLGLALEYKNQQGMKISVGELIAYRFKNKKHPRWQLGSACWMKHVDETICRFGVINLANNAIPVAVKSTSSSQRNPEYLRAMLIPQHVSHQQVRSLILPSLSFDINSELILNMKRSLMTVRLSRMLNSTHSFSQFEFEVLKQPIDISL